MAMPRELINLTEKKAQITHQEEILTSYNKMQAEIDSYYREAGIAIEQKEREKQVARLRTLKHKGGLLEEDKELYYAKYREQQPPWKPDFTLLIQTQEQCYYLYQLLLIELNIITQGDYHWSDYLKPAEAALRQMGECKQSEVAHLAKQYLDKLAKLTLLNQQASKLKKQYSHYFCSKQRLLEIAAGQHDLTTYQALIQEGVSPLTEKGFYIIPTTYVFHDDWDHLCNCTQCINLLKTNLSLGFLPKIHNYYSSSEDKSTANVYEKIIAKWNFDTEWKIDQSGIENVKSILGKYIPSENFSLFNRKSHSNIEEAKKIITHLTEFPEMSQNELFSFLVLRKKTYTATNLEGEFNRRLSYCVGKLRSLGAQQVPVDSVEYKFEV